MKFRTRRNFTNQIHVLPSSQYGLSPKIQSFYLVLVVLFVSTFFLSSCQQRDTAKVSADLQQIVTDVGKRYVPDSRVDVYQINLKSHGDQIIVSGEVIQPDLRNILLDSLRYAAINYTFTDSIRVLPAESVGKQIFGIVYNYQNVEKFFRDSVFMGWDLSKRF
ncbi:MAG: hypothetical protein ACE5HX_10530 [bacterium]